MPTVSENPVLFLWSQFKHFLVYADSMQKVSENPVLFLWSQFRHFVDTSKRELFYYAHISSHRTNENAVWNGCNDILFKNSQFSS